jgi:hypothetical protein
MCVQGKSNGVPTALWSGRSSCALRGGGCRFRIHRDDSPHRHLSPGAPPDGVGAHPYLPQGGGAYGRCGKGGLGQVVDLCALGGALDGPGAFDGCGLRLVGLAGGDDFTVAGFEAEAERAGLVGVDLELSSHDSHLLRVERV